MDFIIKILATVFMIVLVPVYQKNYGISNFLWFSDVGLFLTFFGLWFSSSLLISMASVGVLPLEMIWTVDYCFQLLSGYTLFNIASYMFDAKYSIFLRSLSLFHIAVPLVLFWYLFKWGYNVDAIGYQSVLTWSILIITYLFTKPKDNINWVFLPKVKKWHWISSLGWLVLLMLAFPILIFIPMHFLLKNIFAG